MKKEINKSVLEVLTMKFGNLFAPEVLQKVAEDRANVIIGEVVTLIKDRAAKGVSKSAIIKQYLVDSPACVKDTESNGAQEITSRSEKSDLTIENSSAPNMGYLGADLRLNESNLSGGAGDVK